MLDDVLRVFKLLDNKDFRILMGIEIGMKYHEWVPVDELLKYTRLSYEKLTYRLSNLIRCNMVIGTNAPYEGYQIYFDGYDALALNTFVKRGTISALGDEVGVGKESVVHEAIQEPELSIAKPVAVIVKFHREGRTSFKSVKRVRDHLVDKEHFSWIYAARLAARKEFNILKELYPFVSTPRPIENNRHAIVMSLAKGNVLARTRLIEPEWFLDEIIRQIALTYSRGIIHSDLSEYNIFVNENGVEIIDWPQYVTLDHPNAESFLERDVRNVLIHFKRKYSLKRELMDILSKVKNIPDA